MSPEIIVAILAALESILPALESISPTAIANIVSLLEKILPLVGNFIPTVYAAIKNIISALSANPSTPIEQLSALEQLDAQVDAAFEAAAKDVDPDGTPPA